MVEINPSEPTPTTLNLPQGGSSNAPPAQGTFKVGSGGWDAYKEWLGPEDYKKFQAMLCQSVSRQINHDKEKSKEAKEVMRKSIEGEQDIYG